MDTPKYFNKNGTPEPRYICPPCLSKRNYLEVHTLNYYVAAKCCLCGAVGTFRRLTATASQKIVTLK